MKKERQRQKKRHRERDRDRDRRGEREREGEIFTVIIFYWFKTCIFISLELARKQNTEQCSFHVCVKGRQR